MLLGGCGFSFCHFRAPQFNRVRQLGYPFSIVFARLFGRLLRCRYSGQPRTLIAHCYLIASVLVTAWIYIVPSVRLICAPLSRLRSMLRFLRSRIALLCGSATPGLFPSVTMVWTFRPMSPALEFQRYAPTHTAKDMRLDRHHLDSGGIVYAQRRPDEQAPIVIRGPHERTTEAGQC